MALGYHGLNNLSTLTSVNVYEHDLKRGNMSRAAIALTARAFLIIGLCGMIRMCEHFVG